MFGKAISALLTMKELNLEPPCQWDMDMLHPLPLSTSLTLMNP
jgi:hypothetical protein